MTVSRIGFILCAVLIFIAQLSIAEDKTPHEISGFELGKSIDDYEFVSYQNFLKEVIVGEMGGFRKGIISYGVCERPGEIVKIKMKYKDQSKKFYKELLKKYKKKFGKPDEFTGDAFGIVLSWKWQFTDKNNNYITLTLQHNLKNIDENVGNMIKLSMPHRIEAERKCFNTLCSLKGVDCPKKLQVENWENMIPR